ECRHGTGWGSMHVVEAGPGRRSALAAGGGARAGGVLRRQPVRRLAGRAAGAAAGRRAAAGLGPWLDVRGRRARRMVPGMAGAAARGARARGGVLRRADGVRGLGRRRDGRRLAVVVQRRRARHDAAAGVAGPAPAAASRTPRTSLTRCRRARCAHGSRTRVAPARCGKRSSGHCFARALRRDAGAFLPPESCMPVVLMVLLFLLAVVVSGFIARLLPLRVPLPLLQIAIGAGLSWIGFDVVFDPHLFLLLFIPPLLFLDGWRIPKGAFFRDWKPILALAIGLVVLTVVGMGWFVYWLVP